jgi:Ni,Fe-hydrogenase III large subunit/Ni,Fe-hydrogenase III component G
VTVATEETTRDLVTRLRSVLATGIVEEGDAPFEIRVSVPLDNLVDACNTISGHFDSPLATMTGLDDRARTGRFRLVYVFSVGRHWLSVETEVDAARPSFPSITPHLPAAHWYEREVQDLLGLVPEGHPDPRRLVMHDDWPEGVYPLRKDFAPSVPVPRVAGRRHRFHHLHGEGIVEIPVGPIHAGVIEPGHFRFAAVGELVLHLEARLFYSHRGMEKLAEGKRFDQVLQIAERICGACALSHAVAYCQAIESLAGAGIPPRAAALRSLFLELERLYNHVGDLGNICAGVGFAVGTSQGGRLKEELQRLNERLTGHRFLRGVCQVGGVRRDLDLPGISNATRTLRRIETEFRDFVDLLLSNEPLMDRMIGTGVVSSKAARDLGAVGVAARASGIDRDARRDHPHAAYGQFAPRVIVRNEGDVHARARVRIDEATVSFGLALDLMEGLPSGALATEVRHLPAYRSAIGVTESPRGECLHWVRTGPDGRIDRYRVRSASYCNWPIVTLAVPGNMVPDFPLINKSFELCYSCLDR